MTIIGGAPLYTIALDDVPARTYGFSILLALGGGAYNQTAYSIAQMKVAKERVPHAVSFIMCAQMMGIVLTLVISNASFLNQATDKTSSLLPTASRPAVSHRTIPVKSHTNPQWDGSQRPHTIPYFADHASCQCP